MMVGAVLAIALACGGGSTATPAPAAGTPPAEEACTGSGGTPVDAVNTAYNPQSVTVQVGGVVTWTNGDSVPHTVTFNDGPDCGRFNQGQSVSQTFDSAGEFTYRCTIHPSMRGTVVVQ
jgi:OOP family OmpA-OmpF porin